MVYGVKCQACGLMQLPRPACKACGAVLQGPLEAPSKAALGVPAEDRAPRRAVTRTTGVRGTVATAETMAATKTTEAGRCHESGMAFREDLSEEKPLPWGFWATIGFSFLILLVFIMAQTVVANVFAWAARILHYRIDFQSLGSNGLLLSIATLVSAPFTISVSLLLAKLRKKQTIKEYFCLYSPDKRQYLKWFLSLLVFALCSDGLTVLLGKRVVPEFMVHAYRTAYFTPLLWLAVIMAAPLSEEFVFRGFLFKGIEHSRIGGTGAVLISSLGWASLHLQYDLYGMGTVFVGGILLGVARLKSHSLYIPVMMHAIWSMIATIETAIYVRMVPS